MDFSVGAEVKASAAAVASERSATKRSPALSMMISRKLMMIAADTVMVPERRRDGVVLVTPVWLSGLLDEKLLSGKEKQLSFCLLHWIGIGFVQARARV